MVSTFERNLKQFATYWRPTSTRDLFGNVVFDTPVIVNVRWEDKTEQIIDKLGREVVSMSRIYSADDFSQDGYLFLGSSNAEDPKTVENAHEIIRMARIPDLQALKTLYVAYL